jgi:hypothetical protein
MKEAERPTHPEILIENFFGHKHLNEPIVPGFQNFVWRPAEKDAGNNNVGVDDNSHLLFRIFSIACVMSECLSRTFRALPRASAIKSSNSSMAGGEIALRMTTSFSPITINSEPVFNLSLFRISSGITTWPLDDILVVAIFGMTIASILNLTGKIITKKW